MSAARPIRLSYLGALKECGEARASVAKPDQKDALVGEDAGQAAEAPKFTGETLGRLVVDEGLVVSFLLLTEVREHAVRVDLTS